MQLGTLAVPDGDDEVRADEHVDLAGLHGVLRVDVPERLEHQEQRVVVALELGPLVGVDGVLDGEVVQPEGDRHVLELDLAGFVQAEPDEVPVALRERAERVQVCRGAVHRDPDALAVEGTVDDHLPRLTPLRSPTWQP